jgi:peptidoglycan/xylan/chitin deacetylase (PgdA/CDA1 family)
MPRLPPPPLALAYHGVADVPPARDPDALFVAPGDLRRQIERLRAWGYRLVTFGELAEHSRRGTAAGLAALTFDDGLADNLHALVPALEEAGAAATVFVVSEWLGRPHPRAPEARILTRRELVALARPGVEIGSHSATHADLAALSPQAAYDELARSREVLEQILSQPVDVAAYPFGRAGPETAAACRRAGYRAACRASGEGSWSDPYNLPRQSMGNGSTMLGLRLKRNGWYEPIVSAGPGRAVRSLYRRGRTLVR